MPNSTLTPTQKRWWPWLAMAATVGLAVYLLEEQGRLWARACGYLALLNVMMLIYPIEAIKNWQLG